MHLSKRSQIEGQVFIYLLAIILFGMVLLYGYSAVKTLLAQGEVVEILQTKSNVKSAIDSISYGDRKVVPILVPGRFEKVCFVTTQSSAEEQIQPIMGSLCNNRNSEDYDPIMCNSWGDDYIASNLFLVDGIASDMAYVGKFRVDNSGRYRCIDVKAGKITLRLEGKGKYVALDEYT